MSLNVMSLNDLTGQVFGRLTVVSCAENSKGGIARWNCECSCGGSAIVRSNHLKNGHTQSCGCLQKERTSETKATHGMCKSPEYRSWDAMIQRCTNTNNPQYGNYGGRGIAVCDRWRDFANFYEDMGPRPKGTSIDRINNDGNYELENCQWSTDKEQKRNTRRTRIIEYDGKKKCIEDWARDLNMNAVTIWHRIFTLGWDVEMALSKDVPDARMFTHNGKTQNLSSWSRDTGIKVQTLWERINKLGWSIKRALETPVRYRSKNKSC